MTVIEDGDYYPGRQAGVIRSTIFRTSKQTNEVIVAISAVIGSTSFKNNTNAHVTILFLPQDSGLISSWAFSHYNIVALIIQIVLIIIFLIFLR